MLHHVRHNFWADSSSQLRRVRCGVYAWGFGVWDKETRRRGVGAVIRAGEETREISLALSPADPAPPHKIFENWFAHLEAMLAVLRGLSSEDRGKTLVYNCCVGGPMFNGLEAHCYVKDDSPVAPLHAEVSCLLRPFPRVILGWNRGAPGERALDLAALALNLPPDRFR